MVAGIFFFLFVVVVAFFLLLLQSCAIRVYSKYTAWMAHIHVFGLTLAIICEGMSPIQFYTNKMIKKKKKREKNIYLCRLYSARVVLGVYISFRFYFFFTALQRPIEFKKKLVYMRV